MAIRTNQLALGYLIQNFPTRTAPEVRADVAELGSSGYVVPLHHLRRKNLPAIGAGPSSLEAEEPCVPTSLPNSARDARSTYALVSLAVNDGAAGFAVDLPPIAAVPVPVELR